MAKVDINTVVLGGNLTKDPELRYTPAGKAVCTFTIASNNGTFNDEPDVNFVPIVVWGKSGENCAEYLKKGRSVTVQGRINTRNYENNEGQRVYVTELVATTVVFGSSNDGNNNSGSNSNSSNSNNSPNNSQRNNQDPFSDSGKPIDISDDDLPF